MLKTEKKGQKLSYWDAIDQPRGIASLHNLLGVRPNLSPGLLSFLPADRVRLPSYFEIHRQFEAGQLSFHLLTYLRNAMEGLSFGCARTRVERRSTPSSSNILFTISFVRFSKALLKHGPGKELASNSETTRPWCLLDLCTWKKKRCQLQNEEPKILASSHAEKAMQNQKWQKSFDQKMKLWANKEYKGKFFQYQKGKLRGLWAEHKACHYNSQNVPATIACHKSLI